MIEPARCSSMISPIVKQNMSDNQPKCRDNKHVTVMIPAKSKPTREIRKLEKPKRGKSSKKASKSPPNMNKKVMATTTVDATTHKTHLNTTATVVKMSSLRIVASNAVNRRSKTNSERQIREPEDVAKKVDELTKMCEELKKKELYLSSENEVIRQEENQRELEVEKVVRYWTLARQQLETEQERNIALEKRIQRMRTAHVEQVSLLHKRISMLQLKTEVRRVSASQTDPFGVDSDASQRHSTGVQTVEAWTAQRAHDALRLNDEQLAELIADIEHQKLQAQTDFKFAVVQVEQRLREQHDVELRAIKEDRERQIEDMSRIQSDRILMSEQENAQMKKEFTEQIVEQKVQITRLTEKLSDTEAEIRSLTAEATQNEKTYKRITAENETLTRKVRSNQVELNEAKRVGKIARQLRQRLEKIEEINEILLGEFQKVESECNHYFKQLYGSSSAQTRRPSVAREYTQRLDDIRREFGGLHLSYKI